MGYELHIIRKHDYENDKEKSSISLNEWLDYVANDSELELTNGCQMNLPNIDTEWKDDPGFALWTAHPTGKPSDTLWFSYFKGYISAKYPDDETIKKMLSIAKALNGKVQGDDDEFYDETYFANKQSPENLEHQTGFKIVPAKKPWWKFW